MNEYIVSVVGVVLVCSLLTAILPEGKTRGLIKSIAKVACVFTIVTPIFNFFSKEKMTNNEDFFSETVIKSDPDFIDYCSTISVRSAKEELEKLLLNEIGVELRAELLWRYEEGETQIFGISYEDRKINVYKAIITANVPLSEDVKKTVITLVTKTGIGQVEFGAIGST